MIVVEDEYFHGLECDVGSLKVSFFKLFGDLKKCLVRDALWMIEIYIYYLHWCYLGTAACVKYFSFI